MENGRGVGGVGDCMKSSCTCARLSTHSYYLRVKVGFMRVTDTLTNYCIIVLIHEFLAVLLYICNGGRRNTGALCALFFLS